MDLSICYNLLLHFLFLQNFDDQMSMMNFAVCFLAAVAVVAGNPGYGYRPMAPAYMAPSYSAPAYKAPAYKAPAYSPPAYSPPAYKAPAYSPPAYSPPAYRAPAPSYYKKMSY